MLGALIMVHALAFWQEPPPAERPKAPDHPSFQAGTKVVFPNGLAGVVGVGQLDAPLSDLPAIDTWVEVVRKATPLRLDPASDGLASIQAAAEAFRSALAMRRQRDWQPRYDAINALMAGNSALGGGDDEGTIALASQYSRDCVRASLSDFDAEAVAFVGAIAKASGAELDPEVAARASRLLWRTRATGFLRSPGPVPVPPVARMSLRDEASDVAVAASNAQAFDDALCAYEAEWDAALRDMINAQARAFTSPDDTPRVLRLVSAMVDRMEAIDARAVDAVAALVDDPSHRWLRDALVRRNPHAKEVIDAWLGVRRLLAATPDPAIRALIEPSEDAFRSRVDEMRVAAREGWRAFIVFGATPSHPDQARYRPQMRRIAAQAQQQAMALIADIDRAAGATDIRSAVRVAVEPATGPLPDVAVMAAPIAPEWPPRLGDAPKALLAGASEAEVRK